MKKKKLTSALTLSFLSVLALSALFVGSVSAEDRTTVTVGVIYPLTGPMSSFGADEAKALPILERRVNAEQQKYIFKFKIEDGMFGQGSAAITAAKKLVEVDGAKFLAVGSSGEMLQIAPYVESSSVLAVCGFSSHPAIRSAGDYVFRTYFDIERGEKLVLEDIQKKGIERIAILTEVSSFTSAVREALQNGLGQKVVYSGEYTMGDADLASVVTKLRASNPQAIYLNTTTPSSFITVYKKLKEVATGRDFYTYYLPSLKEVQDSLGGALDGISYLDFPATTAEAVEFRSFLDQFTTETGAEPKAPFNFRTNYNALQVIVDAIEAVGPDPTKAKDYLYSYDRPSATGRLRFDSNGDAVGLDLVLKRYGSKE